MTPEARSEHRFHAILNLLETTGATLRNGLKAADLNDLMSGVHQMAHHRNIEGGPARYAEVAFKFRAMKSVQQVRIGAALAATLISDKNIVRYLDQYSPDQPPIWDTYRPEWTGFINFTLRIAEDFLDLQFDNFNRDTSGMFIENIELNTRKPDANYYHPKLGVDPQ